jgi:ATP adenylyltransferase
MLVAPLPPSHNLVLNKFAIVPEHFILATQAFAPQTHLLEREDLEVAYACVEAYHSHSLRHGDGVDGQVDGEGAVVGGGEADSEHDAAAASELYVFFNSGPASGSSQPHRHVQLLPVRRMREGLSADEKRVWPVLAGELMDHKVRGRVPFLTFAERIGGKEVDLEAVYLRLYRKACEAVLGSGEARAGGEGKEARVDYNLAMTRDVMVIAPRVVEGTPVSAVGEDGQRREVGNLALNGSVLAGTALVKTQAEWDALRAEPEQLLELLGRIGVPNIQAPPLL